MHVKLAGGSYVVSSPALVHYQEELVTTRDVYMKANLVERSLVAGRTEHRVIETCRCVDIEVSKNHDG